MADLGMCPWCLVEVRSAGTGGMSPVEQTTPLGRSLGYWHQGCIADMDVSNREATS